MDKEKLVKLLNMTTAGDGEALNAIRLANNMIKAASLTWEDLIGVSFKKTSEAAMNKGPGWGPAPPPRKPTSHPADLTVNSDGSYTGDVIDKMLESLDKNTAKNSGFRDFINDILSKYEKKGSLTPAQYQSIKRSYDRLPRSRSFK